MIDTRRDLRIDLLRGLALVMIFLNHIPDNVLSRFTSRNLGFSDAAEAFVLLSGLSAGLAYSPARKRPRLAPWRRAVTLWWVQAVIVLAILLTLYLAMPLPGVAEMATQRNVGPVLHDPLALLPAVLLMTHQFACADILPLYIMLLLAAPLMIASAWRWPVVALAVSGLLWLGAGWQEVNLRTWPDGPGWFFNPLSWQFLFLIGLVCGLSAPAGGRGAPKSRLLLGTALAVLLAAAAWLHVPGLAETGTMALSGMQERLGTPDFLTSFDKTFLSPLRLLHALSLAYVLSALSGLHRLAQGRWAAPLAILGRNALPAFATGSILVYPVQILREFLLPPLLLDIVILLSGLNLMLLAALLADRHKHGVRPGNPQAGLARSGG